MKTLKKIISSIIAIFVCLFIAGLFFMSSGMVNEDTGELNEWRTVQVLTDLDKIPLINIDLDDINFRAYGTLVSSDNASFVITSNNEDRSFNYSGNMSAVGEKVKVYYGYSAEGDVVVRNVR